MFELVMMQATAQTEAAREAPVAVESVTVTGVGQKAPRRLPLWSEIVQSRGWPFMGGVDDRSVLVFAKTAANPAGSPYQRVWVRHEYKVQQTDVVEGGPPLAPFRSERRIQEVDCAQRTFRTLKIYRHLDNNLQGAAQALGFADTPWVTPEPGAFDAAIVEAACLDS